MTPTQDKILRDLTKKFMNQVRQNIIDTGELCEAMELDDHETGLTIAGILLYLHMDIIHEMVPGLSPREFASMAEHQFTHYFMEKRKTHND